jgi:hypothetical protein
MVENEQRTAPFQEISSHSPVRQKFIFNPSAWVLRYKAKLRTGRLFANDITCGVRQRGNLLHRLSEIIFAPGSSVDWKTATREQVEEWLEDEWRKLLPAEGANLLLPGNRVASDRLLDQAKRAIWQLIENLRAAAVTKTMVNFAPPHAPFIGGKIVFAGRQCRWRHRCDRSEIWPVLG